MPLLVSELLMRVSKQGYKHPVIRYSYLVHQQGYEYARHRPKENSDFAEMMKHNADVSEIQKTIEARIS